MPFFDFHVHPGMKPRLAASGSEPNPWKPLVVQGEILGLIKLRISPLFADSLDSQASLQQLHKGKVNLIGLILYSLESKVASELLRKSIIKNGDVLQLDPGKLKLSSAGNNYFGMVKAELDHLIRHANAPAELGLPAGSQLKIIRSMSEYNESDTNTIHAILIMEGSQNLFDNQDAADFKEQFFRNLNDFTSRFRLFAMNLCHFQQQPIANQAFAMQFLDKEHFIPIGRGITDWGRTVVLDLYNRGILVDTKHMGLHTRRDLYRIRAGEGITLPLICSHAGLTGISWDERFNYLHHEPPQEEAKGWRLEFLKKWGMVGNTAFNLSTLNLYDEDIVQVLASGGMIGISLDQRIIGFPDEELIQMGANADKPPFDVDYISKQEADVFFGMGRNPATIPPRELDNDEVMFAEDGIRHIEGLFMDMDDLHALYFLNQVLHILKVAKNNQGGLTLDLAMKSICIGSDLDGLVNAIDCCKTAVDFGRFKNQLLDIMSKKSFWKETDFAFGEINSQVLLDGIFHKNAVAFLNKHFV